MPSVRRADPDARDVAYRVLARVDADGAFASSSLDAELRRASLDPRDARLASAIVYGALRGAKDLDAVVDARCAKPPRGDAFVRAVLRAATFQLLGLDRAAAHAVVDHAVSAVRRERGPRVAGFVNAVLRRISVEAPSLPRSIRLDPAIDARLAASVPPAMREALLRVDDVPPLDLRVVRGDVDAHVALLRAARPDAEVTRLPHVVAGIRTRRAGDPRTLPGVAEGALVAQDEGSQRIAAWVGARPGERVLDACAGRGGKTLTLLDAVGPTGTVVATDLHPHRLDMLEEAAARLGLGGQLEVRAVDLTVGDGGLSPDFDAVLVDAPCSGLGTLRRRPEIALRLDGARLDELVTLQRGILARAASLVRPGGRLVYAVCSPLREEATDVVATLPEGRFVRDETAAASAPDLTPEADGSWLLGPRREGDGGGMDAYRVFRFRCVDSPETRR